MTLNPVGAQVKLTLMTLAAAGIFAAGWAVEGWRMGSKIEMLKTKQAEVNASAEQASLERLIAAQRRGDQLQTRLGAAESSIDTLTQEKQNAIRRLTVGRPCLGSAAVRVLNQPAGIRPDTLPAAAGQPVPEDAAFATDTDVGLWIAQCQRGYDTCRNRLDAVADFYALPQPHEEMQP